MSIDLDPRILRQVQDILQQHVPEYEVWVFGSRAENRAKPFSDLDLAIVSPKEVPVRRLALLASAFDESDLPIKVDLVDLNSASTAFQERIARCRELIFQPTQ